jgi:ATP-dependent protease HslVU (ClpYQ) peptidase subunit
MVGDSAETIGERVELLTDKERLKVLKIGDVLVGSAGSVRRIRRLVEHPDWFDTKGAPFDKKFIVTNIIPRFFDDLSEHKILNTKEEFPESEASIIMAHKDRIFLITHSFSVFEIDKAVAIGCTKELINSAMKDIRDGKELDTMLELMRLSGELSSAVRPPYYFMDTESFEYTNVEV